MKHWQSTRCGKPLDLMLALLLAVSPASAAGSAESEAATPLQTPGSPAQAPATGPYTGDPVTLDLVNVELFDFFRIVSELSGLNVIIDPEVKGTITIHVENVPWDQVFETVLKSHGLEKKIEGNVVRVATRERLRSEEELTQRLKRAAFLATDTVTVTRKLNYGKSADVAKALEKQLTERGQINIDERTNTLIISDVAAQMETLLNLAAQLDIPERQVEIEARVIEATTNFSRDLGVQLGFQAGNASRDRLSGSTRIDLPAQDATSSVGIRVGRLVDTTLLDAVISAAERRGEARILSKPRVSAQNNTEARIIQGSRIPIPVTQNFTTTVRFEEAALKLTVTPQITEQNTILLKLKVENNIPDFTVTVLGIPVILISESETRVLVDNGGTTVIGGIFVESDRNQSNRVPGLGSLPILGNLFKRQLRQRDTREILFFITTRIKS
ncbi:MAG: type IV pilus secretin PilQ [Acidobacteria bacterium]|nr:type IV pilus secretin PilQ [Acidobacteriota bacterium]